MIYDRLTSKKIPSYDIDYFHVENLIFGEDQDNETITIDGNCFLFDFKHYQYFHALHDKLGQYEFLKQYVPDLKMVFIANGRFAIEHLTINGGSLITKDLMDLYNISSSDVVLLLDHPVKFKNIYYLYNFYNEYIRDIPSETVLHDIDTSYNAKYHLKVCELLRIRLNEYMDHQPHNKIFISRKNKTRELNRIKKLQNLVLSGQANEMESAEYAGWETSYGERLSETLETRLMRDNTENLIEEYFADLGYQIVTPDMMNLKQQVQLFYNATHVAVPNGTGAYNSIFCKPDTNIFILNVDPRFKWFYEDAAKIASNNVFFFPQHEDEYNEDPFTMKELLESFQKYKELM